MGCTRQGLKTQQQEPATVCGLPFLAALGVTILFVVMVGIMATAMFRHRQSAGARASYFKGEGGDPLRYDAQGQGWFPTGDVATIDPDGFMQITDRSKDVIKSGGEWISSIDVENIAMAHPAVAMAACVGMRHPKWDERPIVVVVKKPGAEVTREELLAFFEGKTAKWQIPDDVVFVDAIPLGATGKMQKMTLRQQLKDYVLPGI